jgi:hypothetical protein
MFIPKLDYIPIPEKDKSTDGWSHLTNGKKKATSGFKDV